MVPASAVEEPRFSLLPWPFNIRWVQPLPEERCAISYQTTQAGLDILDASGKLLRRYWPLPFDAECLALFPDGGLLLGGGNRLRRLKPDGTLDRGFTGDVFPFETYGPAIIQADGSVVFATVSPETPIARVDSAGRLQAGFAAAVLQSLSPTLLGSSSWDIEQQADGKLVIWGRQSLGDQSSSFLYRVNPDGSRDGPAFPTISGAITRLTVRPNSEILANLWDGPDLRLVRLKPDGSVQSVFSSVDSHLQPFYDTPVIMLNDGSTVTALNTLMLNDGSVVGELSQLYRFHPNGTSEARGTGEWPDFYVSNLIPLSSDRLALVYRASCQGGGCYARRLLRIVGLTGNEEPFAWQPPNPARGLRFLAEGLAPEAHYELGVSDDLRQWNYGDTPFIVSSDAISLNWTFDRRTMIISVFPALQAETPARQRFYRLRRSE